MSSTTPPQPYRNNHKGELTASQLNQQELDRLTTPPVQNAPEDADTNAPANVALTLRKTASGFAATGPSVVPSPDVRRDRAYEVLLSSTGQLVAVYGTVGGETVRVQGPDNKYYEQKTQSATLHDQIIAAKSLEYEARGYHVNYVCNDGLLTSSRRHGQLTPGSEISMSTETREVTFAVDTLTEVSRTRDDIQHRGQDFNALSTYASQEVDNFIRFDRVTSRDFQRRTSENSAPKF